MFNTTNDNSRTSFNAPATGIIQKSNKESFFVNFHHRSPLSDKIFAAEPTHKIGYKEIKVAVLQVLLIHNEYVLAELVDVEKL